MLNWKGELVLSKTLRATGRAVDGLLSDCVSEAKRRVRKKTTLLQGSIQMRPSTLQSDNTIVGFWGSYQVKYAIFIEKGTRAHIILPRNKKALFWKGAAHPVPMVFHPGTQAYPFLVPVMEEKSKWLPMRIRMEMEVSG